jgi:hypothetical protein
MADTPDESTQRPTPPRSSKSAPPFFGPRTSREIPETTGPHQRRPSTPLFVPPGSLPPEPTEEKPQAATVKPEPVVPAIAEPAAAAPPAVDPTPIRLSGYFELENLETPEITLNPESDRPSVGGSELQVIEYEEANSGLSSSTPAGGRPSLDGIEFESTELSIELSQERAREKGHAPSDLNIESFWAADAFTPTARPSSREIPRVAVPPEPPKPEPAAAPAPAEPPPEVDVRRSAIDALRVEEVLPPRSPTPPSVRAVTPRSPVPAFAEASAVRPPASLEALKEMEPWAVSAMERPEIAAAIAFELERVARRIRNGELRVRTDVTAPSEESALSAALQAITRTQRH